MNENRKNKETFLKELKLKAMIKRIEKEFRCKVKIDFLEKEECESN
ncbi:hypothetical protein JXA27_06565 [Aerococcaceae bacterium zg-B36]|nr:hypothetical protein [Aerococcaceae bacterium zg-B36]